jgi:RNA polymerase sigma factor (sigma-70 family)
MNVVDFLSVKPPDLSATSAATAPSPQLGFDYDAERFSRVVLPHLAEAHRLARWLTCSVTDAQDVVQEASIRALRGISTFANGNARAWLLTIVRHAAYDWLHKNRPPIHVIVERLEDLENTQLADPSRTTPETALLKHEAERWLAAAIANLPAPLRKTLLLRDVQGLSYRDIADLQDISLGTVMSRLFRARRQLIELAQQHGDRYPDLARKDPKPGRIAHHSLSTRLAAFDNDSVEKRSPPFTAPTTRESGSCW